MKLSKYFEIVNPTYVYLKLTPNNSIRNNNTDSIAKAITSLYKNLSQSIYKFEKKCFYETKSKIAYYIYMENNKVEFYFIIPKAYLQLIKEKINNSWRGITIKEVDKIPLFSDKADKYYLTYRKEDGLSLNVDKRSNTLLNSLMNVIPLMKEEDKVGIFYNFIPISQYGWRKQYENTINKAKDGVPVDQVIGVGYVFKMIGYILIYIMEMIEDGIFKIADAKKEESMTDIFFKKLNMRDLSEPTKRKKESKVLHTQIMVLSDSEDRVRKNNNAQAICTAFNSIGEDNELVSKKVKTEFKPNVVYLKDVKSIKTSTDECQNFLQLPGRELLEEHNAIEKIETQETQVPEELQKGKWCIGTNTYRGNKVKSYLTEDFEYKNLTLAICGPTRAGKSTLIQNLVKNAIYNNECVIVPDYISNNKLSREIQAIIPKSK